MRRLILALCLCLAFTSPVAATEAPDIEVAFSPRGGATELIALAINEAQKELRIAAYYFTSKEINQAVLAAHKRGVDVKVILDRGQEKRSYSSATFLANIGAEVRIDTTHPIMHNKYIVIDRKNVQLGSFNYSDAAENRNAENVMVLRNRPDIAEKYLKDWQNLWDAAKPYKAKY